jgi:predicted transcriptional regulator
MNRSKEKYTDNTLFRIDTKYDKIVIGGDQLWNCKVNYYNENNFLPFVSDTRKKVVYAASLAQDNMREDFVSKFKELSENFSYVTTREKRATEIIEEITNLKAPRVADPAFLLTSKEWEEIAQEDKKTEGDYVFVYQVQSDVELINFAQKLAKDKKCKIIYCPFPLKKQIKCKKRPYISPERWLGYMKNAKYVVTDAFHGTVFSIIFNRLFFVQISSYGKDTGSRITNILEVFSLQDRLLIGEKSDYINQSIDYNKVNKIIELERESSMKHLSNMLS